MRVVIKKDLEGKQCLFVFIFIRYEKSSRFMKVGYERDFLRYLQSLLAEVERRIRRGHARLALSQNQQSSGVSMKLYPDLGYSLAPHIPWAGLSESVS